MSPKSSFTLLTKKQLSLDLPFLEPSSFENRSRLQKILKITFLLVHQKYAIFDHMFFDGHKASFDNFLILLNENNTFKIQLKESLLMSRGKPILN